MGELNNKKSLGESRKSLRTSLTPAEAVLWKALQRSQLDGRKFRRQHSVGNYILDFYCPAEELAVELDGAGHLSDSGFQYDKVRDEYLLSLGIKVLRFENKDVFSSIDSVLEVIRSNFKN